MGVRPGVNQEAVEKHRRELTADRALTLEDGTNIWRIVSGPVIVKVHWLPTVVPSRESTGELVEWTERIVCPVSHEKGDPTDECPLCAIAAAETAVMPGKKSSRLEASSEYTFLVIDRGEQARMGKTTIRRGRIPWRVYKDLQKLYDNVQYGQWCEYDIIVEKTEHKNRPHEFFTTPDREDKDFTDEEIWAAETCKVDIEEDTLPMCGKDIRNLLLEHQVDLSRPRWFTDKDAIQHALDEEGIPYVGEDSDEAESARSSKRSSTRTNPRTFHPRGTKTKTKTKKRRQVDRGSF